MHSYFQVKRISCVCARDISSSARKDPNAPENCMKCPGGEPKGQVYGTEVQVWGSRLAFEAQIPRSARSTASFECHTVLRT